MDALEITFSLRRVGSSQAEIARQLAVSRATVNQVVRGIERSRRVEAAIAKAIGKPLDRIWPAYYKTRRARRATRLVGGRRR